MDLMLRAISIMTLYLFSSSSPFSHFITFENKNILLKFYYTHRRSLLQPWHPGTLHLCHLLRVTGLRNEINDVLIQGFACIQCLFTVCFTRQELSLCLNLKHIGVDSFTELHVSNGAVVCQVPCSQFVSNKQAQVLIQFEFWFCQTTGCSHQAAGKQSFNANRGDEFLDVGCKTEGNSFTVTKQGVC